MAHIVQKWRKVLRCVHKSQRVDSLGSSLLDNAEKYEEEFVCEEEEEEHENVMIQSDELLHNNNNMCSEFRVFNEYDNLQHLNVVAKKHNKKENAAALKDSTNSSKFIAKSLKRVWSSSDNKQASQSLLQTKIADENNNNTECAGKNFNYSTLYNENLKNESYSDKNKHAKLDMCYCEIAESHAILESHINNENNEDNEPLIDVTQLKRPCNICINQTSNQCSSDSKMNLFFKSNEALATDQLLSNNSNNNHTSSEKSLTDQRALSSFTSHAEAFHWYLNVLCDTMRAQIREDKVLAKSTLEDVNKRLNIITAHLLYARNLYEMRMAENNSSSTSATDKNSSLSQLHPALVALACLLDSDTVRIVDSHSCECDRYVYMFATRLKFCAWKAKLFVILKRPKKSSLDRLTLIEDLKNCHRLIQQDKSQF